MYPSYPLELLKKRNGALRALRESQLRDAQRVVAKKERNVRGLLGTDDLEVHRTATYRLEGANGSFLVERGALFTVVAHEIEELDRKTPPMDEVVELRARLLVALRLPLAPWKRAEALEEHLVLLRRLPLERHASVLLTGRQCRPNSGNGKKNALPL